MIGISAQVSLYPLGQASLSPAIDEALRIFRAHGLDVEPGAMSTMISGDEETVFAALQETFRRVAEQGHVVMIVTVSNACPTPSKSKEAITYEPIGQAKNSKGAGEGGDVQKHFSPAPQPPCTPAQMGHRGGAAGD